MKKNKLTLCLTSGFVVAMSLAACGGLSSNDKAVVTIKNSDGKTVDILTDSVYNAYKTETDGISKYYNAILEALVRYEYENTNSQIKAWTKKIKTSAEIKAEAKNDVENDKYTADENAKTNSTSYETEWEKILDSHGCDNEEELLQYHIYQLEKEDITDKFFLFQKDSTLTEEWLGITPEGTTPENNVKGAFPYHIRHVLTSISGGSTNYYNSTITESEAKSLGNTMDALLSDKYNFAQVAQKFSGDSGSAAKGGDAGIMTTSTSFVNEFKLGIYAYDTIYNIENVGMEDNDEFPADPALDKISEGLGLGNDYKFDLKVDGQIKKVTAKEAFKSFNNGKIQTVPYQAFELIKKNADVTKNEDGGKVNNGKDTYYPRNVLFNYYLNFHNPFLITNETIDDEYIEDPEDEHPELHQGTGLINGLNANASDKFVSLPGDNSARKYLTDGEGHFIIGVRGQYGIHFMVMQKSIFDYADGTDDLPSLDEYYTTYTPSDVDYPTKADGTPKDTYVNFIESTNPTTYTTRAKETRNEIKTFDTTYEYRLFEYILGIEGANIKINDQDLKDNIADYISRTRDSNKNNREKTLNESWRTYCETIAIQYDNRTEWEANDLTASKVKLVHPRCAIGFQKTQHNDEAAWEKGGVCYYEE